jgi:hypothetical protein
MKDIWKYPERASNAPSYRPSPHYKAARAWGALTETSIGPGVDEDVVANE